jgi:hypothetical protein
MPELHLACESAVERTDPADERRHADAAGDPDLPLPTVAVVEPAERVQHPRRVAGTQGLDETRGVVARRDRHIELTLAAAARHREGVTLAGREPGEREHDELSQAERHALAARIRRDLGRALAERRSALTV